MRGKRSLNCGRCGHPKVERRGRLVCNPCVAASQRATSARRATPLPITNAIRETKKRYAKTIRPSGLTNQKVYSLRKKYGLSEAQFLALLHSNGGKCDICRDTFTTEMPIDHCHTTGAVRGMLCRRCNMAIGIFRDDPALLLAAAEYLNPKLPEQGKGEHHALADAKWNRLAYEFLCQIRVGANAPPTHKEP